jgi:hypothetical protein
VNNPKFLQKVTVLKEKLLIFQDKQSGMCHEIYSVASKPA